MGAELQCKSEQSYTCNFVALSHHNLPGGQLLVKHTLAPPAETPTNKNGHLFETTETSTNKNGDLFENADAIYIFNDMIEKEEEDKK